MKAKASVPPGQAVEPVGQVHAVAGADDRDHGYDDEEERPDFEATIGEWDLDDRGELDVADERDPDAVEAEVVLHVDGDADCHDRLPHDLLATPDAEAGPGIEEVIRGAESSDEREHDQR